MGYVVQKMKLIPQTMGMSCWYASAQMLINWKEEQRGACFVDLISPEFDAECAKVRDADTGIKNPDIVKMAKRIGLQAVPPLSPTPETLESWLKNYGPLWVNGKSHIVVIAGIDKGPLGYQVLVYDPSPINVGQIDWRSLTHWYALGTAVDSRDTASNVEAVFLYVPNDL